jgi:hypothetical protein
VQRSTGASFINERWGHWNSAVTWVDVNVGGYAPIGAPLLAASAAPSSEAASRTDSQLLAIADAARERMAASLGQDVSASLAQVTFRIADLPGAYLGLARGQTILLDRDAAGQGWFVDPTPRDDAEFAQGGKTHGIDLLTAVMHELGHTLGLPDLDGPDDASDLMHALLAAGERRPSLAAHDAVFAVRTDR